MKDGGYSSAPRCKKPIELVNALVAGWATKIAPWVRAQWSVHGRRLLILAAVYMGITGILRLRYAFLALTSIPEEAIDLQSRYLEVHRWFAGLPLYGVVESADYPAASYVMLWPLLGWLPLESARWLWAASAAILLGALIYLVVRESAARTVPERLFMALLVLPMYATQLTIWLGQLGLHVIVPLAAGLVCLYRSRGAWWEDVAISVLLLASLVKPTLSVPFFWIPLFVTGRWRPITFVVIGYGALSAFGALFQQAGLTTLMQQWLGQGSMLTLHRGTVNVHKWLAFVGLEEWLLPVSLLILGALGLWTARHRSAEIWLLVGVAALVARLWIHHRVYDDILILLPMIALFRLAKTPSLPDGSDVAAGMLLTATWATTLLPYWVFFDGAPFLLRVLVELGQTVVWLAVLGFLLYKASGPTASATVPD